MTLVRIRNIVAMMLGVYVAVLLIAPDMDDLAADDPNSVNYISPAARALDDLGNALIETPALRDRIARRVHAISVQPALYGDDLTTYLVLRATYWRLRRDPHDDATEQAAQQLLEVAKRIEEDATLANMTATTEDLAPQR